MSKSLISREFKTTLSYIAIMILVMIGNSYFSVRHMMAKTQLENKIDRLTKAVDTYQKSLLSYVIAGSGHGDGEMEMAAHEIPQDILELKEASTTQETREHVEIFARSYDRWLKQFVQPVVAKRMQVDAGKATLVDLQALYVSCNPERNNYDLDVALHDMSNSQLLEESRHFW